MQTNYPYSKELKKPIQTPFVPLDKAWAVPLFHLYQKINGRILCHWKPKYPEIQVKRGCYTTSDRQKLVYFVIEKKDTMAKETLLYYHGGGFMYPLQTMMLENAAWYANETGCRVFLPEYRCLPDAGCVTTLEDCYSMYQFLTKENRNDLIDARQLILYGDSAGATLAAGVAQLIRDREHESCAGQMLIYPALDDRSERYASVELYPNAVWRKKSNTFMWKMYLKGIKEEYIPYVIPCRQTDVSHLPPAYVEPQEIDILRDEGIFYADRLKQAGNEVETCVVPGSYHGFDGDNKSCLVEKMRHHRTLIMKKMWEDCQ